MKGVVELCTVQRKTFAYRQRGLYSADASPHSYTLFYSNCSSNKIKQKHIGYVSACIIKGLVEDDSWKKPEAKNLVALSL